MHIQFLRHSFFKVAFDKTTVLFVPFIYTSSTDENFKVLTPCPLTEKDLGKVDLILVSQEHFDHFDKKAIESIAKQHNSVVVSHESVLNELSLPPSQIKPVKIGDLFSCRGVNVEVKSAHQPNSFYPVSFLLEQGGKKVFFAGDTHLTDQFSEVRADVALLPIGGNLTMDVTDAVKAAKTIKPAYAIPMHYNTFPIIQADPLEFSQRIEKSILKTKPVILKPGETFEF